MPSNILATSAIPLLLDCGVKHYDWGQKGPGAFIPNFLSLAPEKKPWAELWAGAHPALPAKVCVQHKTVSLATLIEQIPEILLGHDAIERFGAELPYLFKILAASRPLSIQAHPDRESARIGFEQEESAGIDRGSELRKFRDANHKPEIICAYTDFYALCGFRPMAEIKEELRRLKELDIEGPTGDVIRAFLATEKTTSKEFSSFFSRLMCAPPEDMLKILVPLLERIEKEPHEDKSALAHWILRANDKRRKNPDRGTLAMFFLNLVSLKPGQALYLEPGMPHSYLEGVGLELTGNSDNVLRAGLTSKAVDMDAFLGSINLTFEKPQIYELESKDATSSAYPIPFEGIELGKLELQADNKYISPTSHGPELLICMSGSCVVSTPDGKDALKLEKGNIALIPAAMPVYCVEARKSEAVLFRAGTR